MTRKITLQAWAEGRYDPAPPLKTVQRWARDGWIYPMPEKNGKNYWVLPDAIFIGRDIHKAAEYRGSKAA